MTKNIYQKMIEARSFFQSTPKKKTGYNPHLKSHFFQLDDIIPIVSKIETTFKLLFHINFGEENVGVLTVFNAENPEEKLIYKTPTSIEGMRGMSEVQAVGAMETYSRRYLYMMSLDIVETDELDQNLNPEQEDFFINKTEAGNIFNYLKNMGVSSESIKKTMALVGLNSMGELKRSNIEKFISDCKSTQLAREGDFSEIDFGDLA